MWPSIDHSLLSPSGKISKSALERAKKREHERLFNGIEVGPKLPVQPTEAQALRQKASELYALAARGMKPRAYKKAADDCIKRALELDHA